MENLFLATVDNAIVFMVCEHEYMNMCPPPQLSFWLQHWTGDSPSVYMDKIHCRDEAI